jgi:hypothetical protein
MWTDKLKVGDLIVPKAGVSHDSGTAIIMDVRETNRTTYGNVATDTGRQEFKIWRDGRFLWFQDMELRAMWRKP